MLYARSITVGTVARFRVAQVHAYTFVSQVEHRLPKCIAYPLTSEHTVLKRCLYANFQSRGRRDLPSHTGHQRSYSPMK